MFQNLRVILSVAFPIQDNPKRAIWLSNLIKEFLCVVDLRLSINLDNDQLDAHLLYFTIRPLQSSTYFVDRAS